MHVAGHLLPALVLLAGHVRHERQAEEVLRGGGLEDLPQVDGHVDAQRAVAFPSRHLGAYGAHDRSDDERGQAHAPRASQGKHLLRGQMVFDERGIGRVAPARQPEDGRLGRGGGLVAFVVLVEAVLRLLVVRAVVLRGHVLHAVAFLQIRVEKRLEEAERAASVGHHVRHFEVDAGLVVAHAEEHAFRVDVQAEADGQHLAGGHRHRSGLFQVVPEHAAAQADVEAGEDVHGLFQGALQQDGVHVVGQGGRVAEHRLGGAARLRRVELADVV